MTVVQPMHFPVYPTRRAAKVLRRHSVLAGDFIGRPFALTVGVDRGNHGLVAEFGAGSSQRNDLVDRNSPGFAAVEGSDVTTFDSKPVRDLLLRDLSRFIGSDDLRHEVVTEFCGSVSLAFGVAPFCDHVGDVFEVGAEKEVPRVAADAVVAFVKNVKSIGDRAVVNFVCFTVRVVHLFVSLETTVSHSILSGQPRPARVWTIRLVRPIKEVLWGDALPLPRAYSLVRHSFAPSKRWMIRLSRAFARLTQPTLLMARSVGIS